MTEIPDESIDMIFCDLPYGVTANNRWDNVIPYKPMWEQFERIIKPNGAILLFGQDKFTARTMLSNEKLHRYNIIWKKTTPTGFLNAKRMPLRTHEDIMVFYKSLPTYNPQGLIYNPKIQKRGGSSFGTNYGKAEIQNYAEFENYPTDILQYKHDKDKLHPTQKPVPLLEYLIKTYTNKGEIVLDNCMGSGSTGVACVNTERKFIGIELDNTYFEIAKNRINSVS